MRIRTGRIGGVASSKDRLRRGEMFSDPVSPGEKLQHWQDYVGSLANRAMSSDWECSFKRVTEAGNVVYLELEERSRIGDYSIVVNSVSVYEFNSDGKIRHIDVHLQMELPGSEMLMNYEGVIGA